MLEDLHYPHNAEAVLRSCDAFGVQDVHFIFESQPPYNPRKIGKGTSASAHKWLTFHMHHSTEACLKQLKKEGYEILATVVSDRDTENLFSADLTMEKLALFLGNEREGVSQTVKDRAHQKIHIPMRGMVQSLNLSVTAAILLYEITRQRSAAGRNDALPEKRRKELIDAYIRREQARILRQPHRQNP